MAVDAVQLRKKGGAGMTFRRRLFSLICALAAITLVSCTGSTSAFAPKGSRQAPGSIHAAQSSGLIYVSGAQCGCVQIYRESDATRIGEITDGLSTPQGLAVDSAHNLYVANQIRSNSTSDVLVFHKGETAAFRTIADPFGWANDVAVDTNGTVFLVNYADFPPRERGGEVSIFLPGQNNRVGFIKDETKNKKFYAVSAAALDANHNLYITFWNGVDTPYIDEFFQPATGTVRLKNLGIQTAGNGYFDVVLDNQNDIVTQGADTGEIAVYPPGQNIPSETFAADQPGMMAFDEMKTNLYVVSQSSTYGFFEYSYPGGQLEKTVTDGWGSGNVPTGIAVSP
jgi:hypothetical protein